MHLKEIRDPVVYLSAEFAIDNELPTYSGGLGILAGDIMNQAAIEHYPMVGIGILYRGTEFVQNITHEGKAVTKDSEFDHDTSFLRQTTQGGKTLIIEVESNGQKIKVKSYHVRLSDTTILFFLSTNIDGNPPEWINDMNALYRGDSESQIRQQFILGVGGMKLLKQLEIEPRIYHINEGRPEFIIWEITNQLMKEKNMSFEDAWNEAKKRIVYTNHTLVTAGNLVHPLGLVKKYSYDISQQMGVDNDLLVKDGVDQSGSFNTTLFALNTSHKHNAVSRSHEEYAKRDWPNFEWTYITNGIYMPRWQDSDYRNMDISDEEIWNQHQVKKRELMETVVKRTGFGYDTNKLVITWARRLAEYKQPRVIFSDVEKLEKILTDPQKPVQLLFAGNSHTGDVDAKSIIEDLIHIFSTELAGSAIFVPNYNISLANHLTSGSDVWLNTPKGNLEACGTSGMKAVSNGVLNCTVIDGWTNEVDWNEIGWTLKSENTAESFYETLENDIVPMYFDRDESGIPRRWVARMRKSIELSDNFSSDKMFAKYKEEIYAKM